jgi:hypothetical protein
MFSYRIKRRIDRTPVPSAAEGAGAIWLHVYDAVTTKAGRYVQGGGCNQNDVGTADRKSADSPLEGDGFEPSVPRQIDNVSRRCSSYLKHGSPG